MSRAGFQKSVRMFRKFSEETLRRRGDGGLGREGVAALAGIEATLGGDRLLDGALLEPLAAFTNLLQSAQLPPEFGAYGFGDALLAVEEAHAELRQADAQRWEFSPQLDADASLDLTDFAAAPRDASDDRQHVTELRRCVSEAAEGAEPGSALVVGALRCPDLPFAELAQRFDKLVLSDLDLNGLEQLVRREVPEALRDRVQLERYDLTGSYQQFARGVAAAVAGASRSAEAEQNLSALLQSYDVGAGSAGLTHAEGAVDFVVSALVLAELGRGYPRCVARALSARGFDSTSVERPPLSSGLELWSRLVEQHHVHALLRRARRALLVSSVSEVELAGQPGGELRPAQEPRDVLGVLRLVERLPQTARVLAERSWEWRRGLPGAEKRSLLTLVEAVLV